jgi:hypothetical protein
MQTTEYLKVKFPYRSKLYFGQVIFEDRIRTLTRGASAPATPKLTHRPSWIVTTV